MKRDALCDTLSRELPSSVIFERPKVHTYVYMSALLQLLCVCVCSFRASRTDTPRLVQVVTFYTSLWSVLMCT